MTPIDQVVGQRLALAELEQHHQQRDAEVVRLRAEMQRIHDEMEPHHIKAQSDNAGPANLRQQFGIGVTLGE